MTKREQALNKLWNAIETTHDEIPKELETAYDILHKVITNYGSYKKYRTPIQVVRNTPYAPPHCPRCGEWITAGFTNYCIDCGQALKWRD